MSVDLYLNRKKKAAACSVKAIASGHSLKMDGVVKPNLAGAKAHADTIQGEVKVKAPSVEADGLKFTQSYTLDGSALSGLFDEAHKEWRAMADDAAPAPAPRPRKNADAPVS